MGRAKPTRPKNQSVDDIDSVEVKREESVDATLAQELDSAHVTRVKRDGSTSASRSPSVHSANLKTSRSPSVSSLSRSKPDIDDIKVKPKPEEANGHVSPVKSNPTKSKMGRSASSKQPPPRIAPLFDHLPDVTAEATSSFQVIDASIYQNKYLGLTESALECDCNEEWSKSDVISIIFTVLTYG
jgi:[histone H3]-lysine36 N-trimethyltransferase